jgi:hypothetical protein
MARTSPEGVQSYPSLGDHDPHQFPTQAQAPTQRPRLFEAFADH